jgi:GNAT superfamily N-acetyltransferase
MMSKADSSQILIVPTSLDDVEQMEDVQRATYPDFDPEAHEDTLTAAHFRKHLEIFPEGQFVAVEAVTGRVVGMTSGMRLTFDPGQPFSRPWLEITGGGTLTTHAPDGEWMYGVESCVHPDYQGQGIGSRLMRARLDVARRLKLRGMVAGSVIMNYSEVADVMPVEDYVREVAEGKRFDNNLSKQLRMGFRVHNVIPNYVSDVLSGGWGVAIVWENPEY